MKIPTYLTILATLMLCTSSTQPIIRSDLKHFAKAWKSDSLAITDVRDSILTQLIKNNYSLKKENLNSFLGKPIAIYKSPAAQVTYFYTLHGYKDAHRSVLFPLYTKKHGSSGYSLNTTYSRQDIIAIDIPDSGKVYLNRDLYYIQLGDELPPCYFWNNDSMLKEINTIESAPYFGIRVTVE